MASSSKFDTARNLRAVGILGMLFVTSIFAYGAGINIASQGSGATSSNNPALVVSAAKAGPQTAAKPLWTELTPAQQEALVPLTTEWDKLGAFSKKKWLEISKKFPGMKPDERARMQQNMREWAKLTPEQRRVARESYARSKKLNADQKSAQWQQYQQLPEEQKKKLATEAASKKHVANLPSAQSKSKTIPPIKSTPKPLFEQSAPSQALIPPASQVPSPPATK